MRKEDLVSIVNSMISKVMVDSGFKPNKAGTIWGRAAKGRKDELHLLVQQRGDSVSLHVRAEFTRKDVSEKLSELEDIARVSMGLDALKMKRATCSVTDWKDLFLNQQNAAWLATFTSSEEIWMLKSDFVRLAEVAVRWFDHINDMDSIKAHLLARGMTMSCMTYLVVDLIYKSDLTTSYNLLLEQLEGSKGCDFDEVKKFYEILAQNVN